MKELFFSELTNVAQDDGFEEDIFLLANPKVSEFFAQFASQAIQLSWDTVGFHHVNGHTQVLCIAHLAIVGTRAEDEIEAKNFKPRMLQKVHLVD